MDVLNKISPNLGLQWVEDPDLPWLKEKSVKISLGEHPTFGGPNWLNIRSSSQGKGEFNIDLNKLVLGAQTQADFMFSYHCLSLVQNPHSYLGMLKEATSKAGIVCVIERDTDSLIKEGLPFSETDKSHSVIGRMLDDIGFSRKLDINFSIIGLPHWDAHDRGWFASP